MKTRYRSRMMLSRCLCLLMHSRVFFIKYLKWFWKRKETLWHKYNYKLKRDGSEGKGTCHRTCQLVLCSRKPTWWKERTDLNVAVLWSPQLRCDTPRLPYEINDKINKWRKLMQKRLKVTKHKGVGRARKSQRRESTPSLCCRASVLNLPNASTL